MSTPNQFVKYQRNGIACFSSYEGQSIETIEELLAGLGATDVEFMEESDWWNEVNNRA